MPDGSPFLSVPFDQGALFTPSVGHVLCGAFTQFHDHVLLRTAAGELTYATAWRRVTALAGWLRANSAEGARVAILLGNSQEYVEVILAAALAGRARVPLNGREPVGNQVPKLTDSGAQVVVTERATADVLEDLMPGSAQRLLIVGADAACDTLGDRTSYEAALAHAPIGLDEVVRSGGAGLFRLAYTGGTTGEPKAVMTSHAGELAMARNILLGRVIEPGPDRVFVAATPLSHASGSFVLSVVLRGGSIGWLSGFSPAALLDANQWGAGIAVETFLVPTALADLVATTVTQPAPVHSIVYGGAPCPPDVQQAAADRFPGALSQLYGQAEVPMTICLLDRADHADLASMGGAVGRPFPFVDVRLDGGSDAGDTRVGEIVVRAEHAMLGYWNKPEATRAAFGEDGALRTSDVGRVDQRGYVHIVDRARDLIISGGYNVYPADVERRLAGVPGVASLAVAGASHPRWGEAVVLAVVRSPDAAEDDVRAAIAVRCSEQLASFERPKAVVVVDEIPLSPLGKISRRDLRTQLGELFGRDGLIDERHAPRREPVRG
jgi:acyl-CoA synthetase (AMP-forming)/AMP-acid ligase II